MSRRVPGKEEASNATVDLVAFNCPRCSQPLKPPVYQVHADTAGKLVCFCCYDEVTKMPHFGPSPEYSRCFTVERMLESVRVPCTNASRGCAAMTPYHRWADHESSCPHSPQPPPPSVLSAAEISTTYYYPAPPFGREELYWN
nr:E3 ubiquitin-protein ligase SINA-like 11 [Aegilops tauschii subsp. strangulata]